MYDTYDLEIVIKKSARIIKLYHPCIIKICHALFESHLIYRYMEYLTDICLEGVSDTKLNTGFTVQKYCVRLLFGDRESYILINFELESQ